MLSQDIIVNGKSKFRGARAMSKVLKLARIKHEAEIYFSQGLHQEALTVYKKFLSHTVNLHPTLKAAISESIHRIRSAARHHDRDEAELMSGVEITVIKKGWKGRATNEERLASAQTLVNLGIYEDALEEYRLLLNNRFLTAAVIRGVALCLVNLVRPKHFIVVVDHFASKIFKHPRSRKALKLAIAKAIDSQRYPRHFSALCYHLSEMNRDSETS